MIVWLWDASGPASSACGISRDPVDAREAAGAHLASGTATAATVQAATLVTNSDKTPPHYARFGSTWQATRISDGEIRWDEQATTPSVTVRDHPERGPADSPRPVSISPREARWLPDQNVEDVPVLRSRCCLAVPRCLAEVKDFQADQQFPSLLQRAEAHSRRVGPRVTQPEHLAREHSAGHTAPAPLQTPLTSISQNFKHVDAAHPAR